MVHKLISKKQITYSKSHYPCAEVDCELAVIETPIPRP